MAFDFLKVITGRRLPLNYVSPPVCEGEFSSTGSPFISLLPILSPTSPTGLMMRAFGGGWQLWWGSMAGALCYSVYRSVDDDNPYGEYTLVAECITDNYISPEDGWYKITVITADGESDPSEPFHYDSSGIVVPRPPLPTCGGTSFTCTPIIYGPVGEIILTCDEPNLELVVCSPEDGGTVYVQLEKWVEAEPQGFWMLMVDLTLEDVMEHPDGTTYQYSFNPHDYLDCLAGTYRFRVTNDAPECPWVEGAEFTMTEQQTFTSCGVSGPSVPGSFLIDDDTDITTFTYESTPLVVPGLIPGLYALHFDGGQDQGSYECWSPPSVWASYSTDGGLNWNSWFTSTENFACGDPNYLIEYPDGIMVTANLWPGGGASQQVKLFEYTEEGEVTHNATFTLTRVKKYVPQYEAVQISSFAAIKSLLIPDGSLGSDGVPQWDGVISETFAYIPSQVTIQNSTASWVGPVEIHQVSVLGIAGAQWTLTITAHWSHNDCDGNPVTETVILWQGTKTYGENAVGSYTKIAAVALCAPTCITLTAI